MKTLINRNLSYNFLFNMSGVANYLFLNVWCS